MANESDGITDLIPSSGWGRIASGFLALILVSWVIMGLAAARVDLEGGVLSDIFWTEILIVFWGGLAVISRRLSESARDNPNRASFAHYLPPLC